MDFAAIEESKLFGPALKWKLAAMYNSEHIFQVFNVSVANDMLVMLHSSSGCLSPRFVLARSPAKLAELKPAKDVGFVVFCMGYTHKLTPHPTPNLKALTRLSSMLTRSSTCWILDWAVHG